MSQHSQASSSSKATQSRSNININNDKTSPSQVQQQSEQPSDRPTKRSQPSKRPERRRSKSSSPEKLKVLTRQPSLRLPPYNVDATKWEVDSIGIPPDSTRGTGDEFEGQNLEITRRLDAFQGAGRLRASSFNYARPRPDSYLARCDPPPSLESPYTHLKRPLQRYASPSPETSPTNATLDLDLSPTMTSSDSDGQTSCIPAVPHYVKLFRPRYPPEDPAEPFISPIPNFQSLEHAMAIKEGLTKFHVGVILVDEDAGMDREKRTVGLERVIEENMPTLKALDVLAHHIVFFYHGRGESWMGSEIWDAIRDWSRRQQDIQGTNLLSSSIDDDHEEEETKSNIRGVAEEGEQKEHQRTARQQKEAEKDRHQRNRKGTKKWNDFARQEATKNLRSGLVG